MTDTNSGFADRMIRAAEAFDLVVLQKLSLRRAAAKLSVSHDTVRRDVADYTKYLASERTQEVDERRARIESEMDDLYRRALETYEAAPAGKTLSRVAALNSAISILTHKRAVQGVDAPKEVKADQDITYRVVWDEGDGKGA